MTNSKQIDILWKAVNKQARYIEQLEIIVSHLNKDSHPPRNDDFDGDIHDLKENIAKREIHVSKTSFRKFGENQNLAIFEMS